MRLYTTTEAAESITKAGKTILGRHLARTWLMPDEYLNGSTALEILHPIQLLVV